MTALAPLTPAALALVLSFAGVFGLVIGSFLNVVVYRVPAGIPLTRASQCPSCDQPVRPWQNVPVASWLATIFRDQGLAMLVFAISGSAALGAFDQARRNDDG